MHSASVVLVWGRRFFILKFYGGGDMRRYLNLNGNSSIFAYDFGADYIDVEFRDGAMYRCSYSSAGQYNVEEMKRLAIQGYGLNSYIMRNCRFRYE